jgi:glycosyltransferase involved in cell wall biosynthesis
LGVPCIAVDARTLQQTGKGIPRFLYETLRELAKDPALRLVLFSNRPLHPDNALPIETVIDYRWGKVPGSVWMMTRLNRLAIRAGANIVWGPAHVVPLRNRHLRLVLTVHDLVYRIMPGSMGRWNRLISEALIGGSIRRADHVVADSEATKQDVVSLIGIDAARIETVHLGTRLAPADLVAQSAAVPGADDGYLFVLGSIEPRKNIEGLLDCLVPLRQRVPSLSLRLTGAHSWSATKTLARIKGDTMCRLLGFLSDREIAEQMAGARAFVMPSHYEGFGLPIIEAVDLAPIIAADIPVFRELGTYIDGICFIDFGSPDQAAETITNFLATMPPPARFKPGAANIFRWSSVARRYAGVFAAA